MIVIANIQDELLAPYLGLTALWNMLLIWLSLLLPMHALYLCITGNYQLSWCQPSRHTDNRCHQWQQGGIITPPGFQWLAHYRIFICHIADSLYREPLANLPNQDWGLRRHSYKIDLFLWAWIFRRPTIGFLEQNSLQMAIFTRNIMSMMIIS